MDAAEAAVRHEDDEIAVGVLAGNHLHDLIKGRRIARALPGACEIDDELLGGEPLAFGEIRAEHGRDHHLVCRAERPREILLKHAPARGRRARFEHRPDAAIGIGGAQARQRFRNGRRMMREVVVHFHAARLAEQLEPALHAFELAQPRRDRVSRNARRMRHGDGRERVPDVMRARQRQHDRCESIASAPHRERLSLRRHVDIAGPPVGSLRKTERFHAAERKLLHRQRGVAVGAEQRETRPRHEVHQPPKGQPDGVEVGVDVCVIELDVVDDGNIGQILQELGGLVEERAVVLIAFNDEVSSFSEAVARAAVSQVPRDASHENARIETAVHQQPACQRRGRRLAVRAGNDDRTSGP